MKKLRKKSNNDNLPDLLTPNNSLATTDKDKANTLNNFFLSQSSTDSPSDPIYKLCPPPLPTSARLCEIQVSPAEVYSALSSLKEKKAAGIDGLPNSLPKVAICFSLAALFNNSLLAGKLPRDWKRANVRAIYKRGPKHLPDNYRPISLLSSVTKVLESLVNKSLSNFLSANNLISPFQSGFRRGDSAPLQLFLLTTELFAAVDSRAVAAAVFYDFKKMFDSVWHRALIGKLFSAGVSGSALEWLSDFITDRTQHSQVGDSLSNPGSPMAGVPQGSPLSPTLFILFINSVTSSTSCPTNCFADDNHTWPAIHHRSTKNPIRCHSSSHLGKRSQAHYPSREDRLHAVSPPTPPSARPQYLSKQSCHHPSPPAQAPWCYTFFHPFLVTSCRTSYLPLFCNAWSSSSSPLLLPFFISLSTKSLSLLHTSTPSSGVWLLLFCRFVCSLCSPA